MEEGGCDGGRGYGGMNESSLFTSGTYGDHACACSCCAVVTDSRCQVNRRETRDAEVNRPRAHWLRLIWSVFPLTPPHPSTHRTSHLIYSVAALLLPRSEEICYSARSNNCFSLPQLFIFYHTIGSKSECAAKLQNSDNK